ncbi:MAG: glutaredoxin [Betaproteobacteria bacterium]|nr:glutaredoxin [Betaproteobacteria bacterium]
MSVKIEVIAVPGCNKPRRAELRAAAVSMLGEAHVVWREVNVLELDALDFAVSLRVLSMPAFAVNGELKFSSLPSPEQFRAVLSDLDLADGC